MNDTPAWLWITFGTLMAVLLAADIFVHRGGRGSDRKTALVWSAIWIAVGLGFAGLVFVGRGWGPTSEYFAAYLIEKSLSLDNMFVFLIIFSTLAIPKEYQHNVLAWGVFGALVFRAIFIFFGMEALESFGWVTWIFGGILIVAGIHAFREDPVGTIEHGKESKLARWIKRHLPVTQQLEGGDFFKRQGGKILVTPLFVALLAIEITDVVFAIDSVPAALSMSRDRFIVYSSNAFAILGLRSLYLALVALLTDLRYLHYGLAFILGFAGLKLITHEFVAIPPLASVAIIVVIMGVSVIASLHARKKDGLAGRSAEEAFSRPSDGVRRDDQAASRPGTG